MAYASLDISRGENGCLLWFDDLVDIKELSAQGQDIYIRMASSELDSKGRKPKIVIVSLSLVTGIVLIGVSLMLSSQRRKKIVHQLRKRGGPNLEYGNDRNELPQFDLNTITKATDNFSINNKLGEGGFGPVYKAWMLYREEKSSELVDSCLGNSRYLSEVARSIHIGLLCVQQCPEDRPSMSSVVLMLANEDVLLPQAKQPGFFTGRDILNAETSGSSNAAGSTNEMTVTLLHINKCEFCQTVVSCFIFSFEHTRLPYLARIWTTSFCESV
ncbi:hypothetical protein BUALT_Bualt03G0128300 [Buddleja alternifolia]|uniref:S-locus receptor kinase C-terminal domain-containing protein n=1 Tax=Buddleja alternifolia TaxID=168488 RepID=A0AAV6XXK2_9LAMI|nr:hypothetical protein BUALT_Bualt03G0128300 [Buddleja alternifolia]